MSLRGWQRRVCGLCGRWFLLVLPDEVETERDKLCMYCRDLPPPPEESQ
jgi:hypothetical protein